MILVNSAYYASIFIFISGLALKLLRTPFHTVVMLVGLLGFLIVGIIFLASKNAQKGLISFASFGFAAAFLALLKFWPGTIVYSFIVLALLMVYLLRRQTYKFKSYNSIFPGLILILTIGFGLIAKPDRYYLISIKYNHHIEKDFYAWNKYAWFLNSAGRYPEAITALAKAEQIARDFDDDELIDIVDHQREKLNNREWDRYIK